MALETPTMAGRTPAQAVIEELLRQHADTPPRSRIARFFGFSPLGADCVSWYEGARGEIAVGKILATLPPGWSSFHALPIGKKGSDIDHLVVGPGGVFTINTKHHRGKAVWVAGHTLMVSGQKQPYIRKAEHEAKRVTTLLQERMPELPPVRPLLALVNAKSLTIKTKPEQVAVLTATGLRRWLLRRPAVLGEAQVDEAAALIGDREIWPPDLLPAVPDREERFNALDAQVRGARLTRILWAALGAVLIVAAGPSLISALFQVYVSALVKP